MEGTSYHPEKDSVIFGGLFQTIINDLRGSSPIWEDFTSKAVKLHAALKTTMVAIGAFLEAFQKVADMATSSKGATREIGSALTRLCMRHRSIEAHLKTLTSSILDHLVAPLQDKLEDWKKSVAQLDKDHSKENKRARQEIKKAASDTIRLQKKVRKGSTHGKSDMQQKLDSAMIEVNSKYHQLEETEKSCVRSALIEERSRFCLFITCLKPFVDQELKLLTEMSHINEIMDHLCLQASEPSVLPASSEQVLQDLKGVDASYSLSQAYQQSSPPSSPSSLGSRKSSMCSINSIHSSSSGSLHSPSHNIHKHPVTYTQPPPASVARLTSVSGSQDSGFTSQDTLYLCLNNPQYIDPYQGSDGQDDCDSTPTTPSDNTPSSTWNNWPNLPAANSRADPGRPHTISSAYEKGHSRPALKLDMFEPPQPPEGVELRPKTVRSNSQNHSRENRPSATISKMQPVLPPHGPKPKIKAVPPPVLPPGAQPIYANMAELEQAASNADLSPDDGEPTTPTTPANTTVSMGGTTTHPAQQVTTASDPLQTRQGMSALDVAMEQMGMCASSLSSAPDAGGQQDRHVDITDGQYQEEAVNLQRGVPDTQETRLLVEGPRVKIQHNTSLELAKAIRELEASTAALNSAYDSESYAVVTKQTVMTSGSATGDTDSYTSKMSLQCSSGYGTMNSTPAGSEDTIASGATESIAESALYEELDDVVMREGIPAHGGAIGRRSSVNSQKPPPPIRRTASVSGVPTHVQLAGDRPLDSHFMSGDRFQNMSHFMDGGDGFVESPYAELQIIQQSIQLHARSQSIPASPSNSSIYQPRISPTGDGQLAALGHLTHSDGTYVYASGAGRGSHIPPPLHIPTTSLVTTQNAKLVSSLPGNDSVADSNFPLPPAATSGGHVRGALPKSAPQVMQKPNRHMFPPPPSATMGQQAPSVVLPAGPLPRVYLPPGGQPPQYQMYQQPFEQYQQIPARHAQSPYSQPASYQHHPGATLPTHPEEDFPLPPTQEELQELEKMGGLPQQQVQHQQQNQQHAGAATRGAPLLQQQQQQLKKIKFVPPPPHHLPQQLQQHPSHLQQQQQHPHVQRPQQHQLQQHHLQHQQLQHQHQLQQQQHSQQHQPRHSGPDVTASLMMELKKRVSVEDSTDA